MLDDPDLGFSRVTAMAVGENGLLYVVDGQERQIRVFDASGRRVGTIGGRGRGPGELESATRFGVLGDTVWVADLLNRRLTLFSSGGDVLATLPMEGPQFTGSSGVLANVVPFSLEPGGTVRGDLMYMIAVGPEGRPGDAIPHPRLRFDLTGQVLDTLGWDTLRIDPVGTMRVGGRERYATVPPLSRRPPLLGS